MKCSDAHFHLSDSRIPNEYKDEDYIDLFCCAATADDWNNIKSISEIDDRITPFFGTHPWFIDSYEGREPLIDIIERTKRSGIGEIGVDSNHPNMDKQIVIFEEQLSIAEDYSRPVSIHMVKSEEIVLKMIRKKDVQIILHSFTGPESYIRPFSENGCFFSISPRMLNRPADKVRPIIEKIPKDRLLVETDYPNNRIGLIDLIRELSVLMHISETELAAMTADNQKMLSP